MEMRLYLTYVWARPPPSPEEDPQLFLPRLLAALPAAVSLLAAHTALGACAGRDLSGEIPAAVRAGMETILDGAPFPEGRHWAVEKGGKTSWIFGTIHLPMDSVATPPPELREEVEGADELLIEITRDEEQRMLRTLSSRPELVLAPGGQRLSEALPPEEWEEVRALSKPYGIPAAAADRLAPWYLTTTLANPACLLGEAGDGILDRRIERLAEAADVTVTGLERYEDVFDLFADVPYDAQVKMLRAALPSFEQAEDFLETTRAYYARGEILKIRAFSDAALTVESDVPGAAEASEALFDRLLFTRNDRWMEVLLPKLEEGNRVVAVGALHLPGRGGLLDLLAREGFTIRRLDG